MNISYKWLKRYIDFSLEPRELAAALTSIGLECDTVEEVESIRGGLRGIVTGKVLTCVPHPNSDHLHITTVDLGSGDPVQIVCGAPNVAAGQNVIVATVGATLYDGDKEFKIKKSKMRGEESCGMICAEDEIGVGSDHAGIMVLPEDVKPGTPAAQYFKLSSDYCLEVELTPNRVDAASHFGVARDLKAYLACRAFLNGNEPAIPCLSLPDVEAFAPDRTDGAASVEVLDKQGCPRYSGITIRGVQVKESPEWLRNLLTAAGQRPINNIVDITNFILLGLGQPLHSFDLAKVKDEKIVVRTCPDGTEFVTLDGQKHLLTEADLMICDSQKPLCIAGVFGGLESGVTEQTTDLFIESAWFNPTRIRRTARRHGLSTDASFRYERGTDPEITVFAAKLAALLIKELAGGEICGPVVDECSQPIEHAKVDLDIDYCSRLIGKELPLPLVKCILEALEIKLLPGSTDKTLKLDVPPYRVDVTRPCDIVEEILRIYGYNNVEFGMEMHANLSTRGITDLSYALQNTISEQLTGEGFAEIMNNSLTASSYFDANPDYPAENCVKLMNPLSTDLSLMRPTLLYGGLESISRNVNRKSTNLKLYEFGNIYHLDPEKKSTPESPLAPYSEEPAMAMWLTGDARAASWNSKASEADFFLLRAYVDNALRRLGIPADALSTEQSSDHTFTAKLTLMSRTGERLGIMGLLRPRLLREMEIEQSVVFAELRWRPLLKMAAKSKVEFSPLPKTLPVSRDLALLLDASVPFGAVKEAIRKAERKMLRGVELFDVYQGEHIPEGKKSYAVSILLQDDEKTLTDKQIDAAMKRIVDTLRRELNAELR